MVKYVKANKFSDIVDKRERIAYRLRNQILDLLRKNNLYYDVSVVMQEPIETSNNYVAYIQVDAGDWKHEHLALDALINKNFDVTLKYEEITDEDGSDTYSSEHRYSIRVE